MDNVMEREAWERAQARKNLYRYRRLKWADPPEKLKLLPKPPPPTELWQQRLASLPWEAITIPVIIVSLLIIGVELLS